MSRGTKGIVLLALLAGIAVCVRMLALGRETVWMPLLSGSAARLVFRSLTIALGLAAWFVSQSLIGARALCEGGIGDAVHEWTAPLNGRFSRHRSAANVLLITTSGFIDLFGLPMKLCGTLQARTPNANNTGVLGGDRNS